MVYKLSCWNYNYHTYAGPRCYELSVLTATLYIHFSRRRRLIVVEPCHALNLYYSHYRLLGYNSNTNGSIHISYLRLYCSLYHLMISLYWSGTLVLVFLLTLLWPAFLLKVTTSLWGCRLGKKVSLECLLTSCTFVLGFVSLLSCWRKKSWPTTASSRRRCCRRSAVMRKDSTGFSILGSIEHMVWDLRLSCVHWDPCTDVWCVNRSTINYTLRERSNLQTKDVLWRTSWLTS